MSYILDALKKSEQERGHGNVPGVQTIHSSSINYRKDSKPVWPYILIIAIIVNIAVIVYFNVKEHAIPTAVSTGPATKTSTSPDEAQSLAAPVVSASTAQPSAEAVKQPKAAVDQIRMADTGTPANQGMKQQPATPFKKTTPAEASAAPGEIQTSKPAETEHSNTGNILASESSAEVIDYNDLSPDIKSQLPAIIISAHVYSSNPQQRSIVINNNFMEEGEYLIDNIRLKEITREGAILEYQGILFRYGSVSSWR
jgi:general secretion pathway protein B